MAELRRATSYRGIVRVRERVVTAVRWCLASSRRAVTLSTLGAIGLHLLFLSRELGPDEGGFLLVASQWQPADDGRTLYTGLWVDRPPLILLVFRLADEWGPFGVRLVACLAAGAFVLTAAWAAWVARGERAAKWAAVIALALGASALIGAQWLNGELIAAPLVMAGCALVLHALLANTWRTQLPLAVAAGACSVLALLVKQNVVDGLVFGTVLAIASVWCGTVPRRTGVIVMLGLMVGAAAPLATVAAWAASYASLDGLWFALVGFRSEAAEVIVQESLGSSALRLAVVAGLAVASGLVALSVGMVWAQWRALRVRARRPLALAIGVAFAVEVAGVLLGGSYWPHYLVGLVPMLALGGGLAAASQTPRAMWQRRLAVVALATTLVATPAVAIGMHATTDDARVTGEWLGASARPRDTAVVTYTHPNLLQASGLATPYPYVWSLPVRTNDPELDRLRAVVAGPRPPTWIVERDPFDSWGLDDRGRLGRLVEHRYRVVMTVCESRVWLRRGEQRRLAGPPAAC